MSPTIEEVDNLLPQTQCGLCGYKGCLPYATALVTDNAAINLCPPGGVTTLEKLGTLLQKNPEPYIDVMRTNEKLRTVAVIREAECIGCTKCISACPVDAIIGAAKQMHTVITDLCTGCDLCVPPCPVDCIDMVATSQEFNANAARTRFQARNARLEKEEQAATAKKIALDKRIKLTYIENALLRVKEKKQL